MDWRPDWRPDIYGQANPGSKMPTYIPSSVANALRVMRAYITNKRNEGWSYDDINRTIEMNNEQEANIITEYRSQHPGILNDPNAHLVEDDSLAGLIIR